jgi:hypothetical protein
VIEYSTALNRKDGKELVFGGNSIISQVVFSDEVTEIEGLKDIFLHTVVTRNAKQRFYVTILFGINDDLKSTVADVAKLSFNSKFLMRKKLFINQIFRLRSCFLISDSRLKTCGLMAISDSGRLVSSLSAILPSTRRRLHSIFFP